MAGRDELLMPRTVIEIISFHEDEFGQRSDVRVLERMGIEFRTAPADSTVIGSSNLTFRERQVLDFVKEGKVNKEIAQHMNISLRTVKSHVSSLLIKFAVTNRTQLIYALSIKEKALEPAIKEAQEHFAEAR